MATLLDTTVNGDLEVTGTMSLPNHSNVDNELDRTLLDSGYKTISPSSIASSSTFQKAGTFTLDPGTWIIMGMWGCSVSSDNKRIGARFVVDGTTCYYGAQYLATNSATNTYQVNCMAFAKSTSSITVDCYVCQTSGSAKTGTTFYYNALKVGGGL